MELILFDMMDTLLVDPYFQVVEELLPDPREREIYFASRQRSAFEAFERGELGEREYFRRFYRPDLAEGVRENLPDPAKIKKRILRQVRPFSGVKELLADLKENESFRLGIASNYSPWYGEILERQPWISESFQYLFFSCEMGVRKPDREYYKIIDLALRGEGGEPLYEKIRFVDDRESNLLPAAERGWQVHRWRGAAGVRQWLYEKS